MNTTKNIKVIRDYQIEQYSQIGIVSDAMKICNIDTGAQAISALSFQFYQMNLDIFESTRHWVYTKQDQLAEIKFGELANKARQNLPKEFFDRHAPDFLLGMRKNQIYSVLKTLPKGVLHNVFFDCCEDRVFYRNVILKHPNVYVTKDYDSFKIATKEQAKQNGWKSMEEARKQFQNEDDFIEKLFGITTFSHDEAIYTFINESSEAWKIFEKKMINTDTLIYSKDIFVKYVEHVLQKFVDNGYQRVQFRAQLVRLQEHDENGNLVKELPEEQYGKYFDIAANKIEKDNPGFSVGMIFGIKKSLPDEEILAKLDKIFTYQWDRIVGLDFFLQEDIYGNLNRYNNLVDEVAAKYPQVRLWKCYHAGETKNPNSTNIEEAVNAGSVRIGHGLNVLQRVEFLPFCKHVCFEKCPLSNLMLGYTGDPRESSGPILLGLGYAVTVNMGDSGKLGAEDSTGDFFVSAISYDWTFKYFKLIVQHSINHCLVREKDRRKMQKQFYERWDRWVCDFLATQSKTIHKVGSKGLDIFTGANNWTWTEQDQIASQAFEKLRKQEIANLPKNFFRRSTLSHFEHIKSGQLYPMLKQMPKGCLHHLHIDCTEDEDFYKEHIITDPNIYLDKQKKHFVIGTVEEAKEKEWVSWKQLAKEIPDKHQFLKFVANVTMLNKEEIIKYGGKQSDFWGIFEQKISNFFPLVFTLHIFKKYIKHVLLKYIKNGYDRVEFRALLCQLTQYDENGKFVKVHDEKTYMDAFDEMYFEVQKIHPEFTSGLIFFGLKMDSEEVNFNRLDKACSYEWPRMIGIDFVQQEDPYGSMEPYIRVGDRIVKKYAHLDLKKVYHAGETKDHTNNNVELSVRSGSVRIGHGLNIVKKIHYLQNCKHICFELNPMSNLLTGGMTDIRMSTAPLLLGLGYAVSISPDDPGKFGYEDTTVDIYYSAVSFNWTLRHFKLIAFHAINHAIVTGGERLKMLESFNKKWDQWVLKVIQCAKNGKIEWPKRGPANELPKEEEPEKKKQN